MDINAVREFAIAAHGDQKWGDEPYIFHLDQVREEAKRRYTGVHTDIVEIVALLHDLFEDTAATPEQVIEVVGLAHGPLVVQLIFNLKDEEGANRAERKRKTWHKIRSHELSVFVKLIDRLCNTPGKLKSMYRKEFPLFEAALYVPGQFDALWEELRDITYND